MVVVVVDVVVVVVVFVGTADVGVVDKAPVKTEVVGRSFLSFGFVLRALEHTSAW